MPFQLLDLRHDSSCVACTAAISASSRVWWNEGRNLATCTRCRPVDFEPVSTATAVDAVSRSRAPRAREMTPLVGADRSSSSTLVREQPLASDPLPDRGNDADSGTGDEDRRSPVATSWGSGGHGANSLGDYFDGTFDGNAVVLHAREFPDTSHAPHVSRRTDVDHVVIASSGVWIVDVNDQGGVVDVRTDGTWTWQSGDLYVGRRNQKRLVDGVSWQAAAVQNLVEPLGLGFVPVHSVMCFVHSTWSASSNAAVVDGVLVVSPDKLCSIASLPGPLEPDAINALATQLNAGLPTRR